MSKYLDQLIKQKQAEIQRLVAMNTSGKDMGIAGSASGTVNECREFRRLLGIY